MKMNKTKLFSLLMALTVLLTVIPFDIVTANAADGIVSDENILLSGDDVLLQEDPASIQGNQVENNTETDRESSSGIVTEFVPDVNAGKKENQSHEIYRDQKEYSGTVITRAQWLDKLVTSFGLTANEGYMSDDYYPDVTSTHACYKSIKIAVMHGLIDVEPGENMEPDEPATRQFVADTLNILFGYLPQDKISISDVASSDAGYNNAVVAVDMGWFVLSDSNAFNPDGSVKSDESEDILTGAAEAWNDRHTYSEEAIPMKYKDGVKVISDNEFTINRDATMEKGGRITTASIIITDLTEALTPVKDELFVVEYSGFPALYKAVSVAKTGNKTTINIDPSYTATGEDHKKVFASGKVVSDEIKVNLEDIIPAEDVEMTYEVESTGETYDTYAEAESVAVSEEDIIPRFETTIVDRDGVKVDVDCKIENVEVPRPEWNRGVWGYPFDDTVKASVNLDTVFSISAKIDGNKLTDIPNEIVLCEIPVAGIGYFKVSSKIEISGSVVASKTTHHHFEIGYDKNAYFSYDCEEEPMALEAHAELRAGIYAELGLIDMPVIDGEAWVEAGVQANVDAYVYNDGNLPTSCINLSAWVYADGEAYLKVAWKEWSYPFTIYDKTNSPIKTSMHIEDLVEVSTCSRAGQVDANGKMNNGVGYNGSGNGWRRSGNSNWSGVGYWQATSKGKLTYTYDEEKKTASVKSWTGSGAVVIPETTEKDGVDYTVTAIGDNAFKENKNENKLYAVTMPDSIIEIGSYAFSNCTLLTCICLPDSVTKIENHAFYNCSALRSVSLSKNLEEIGWCAFSNCSELTGIEIPKSLKKSSTEVFKGCDKFKNVTFEQGITIIPDYLFSECKSLEKIEIPITITQIGEKAFGNCSSLNNVRIPQYVTSIGSYAFQGCTSFTDIIIPDSVTKIENHAFYNCSALRSVTLSKNLEEIGWATFLDCSELTGIEIPKSLKKSGSEVFKGCKKFKNISFEKGTTSIPDHLFSNSASIETIGIPETIESIGEYAFKECTGLLETDIPDSVLTIGGHAFFGCTSLSKVKLSKKLSKLEWCVFSDCSSLKEIEIPDGIISISSWAFNGCQSLEEMDLPDSVNELGNCAFEDCTSLKKIHLPDGLINIPYGMFYNCTSLRDIDWPINLENIKSGANTQNINETFGNCDSLKSVDLSKCSYLREIGGSAFKDCDALITVKLSPATTTIGSYAFQSCDVLKDVELGSGLTAIPESAFADDPALESIVISRNVKSIADNAFKNDTALTEIYITPGTTSISDKAFSYPTKMTCYGTSGSYAETYAKAKGMRFVAQDYPVLLMNYIKDEYQVNVGSTLVPVLEINPVNYSDDITYTSSDEKVFTVTADGTVKGIKVGEATLTARSTGGINTTVKIKVVRPVTSVSLDKTKAELVIGKSLTLTAKVYPTDATDKTLTWKSSDEKVATVDKDDKVTAIAEGTAVITATASNGKSASCTVTVVKQIVVAESISVSPVSKNIAVGDTFTITASVLPESTTDKSVTWTSGNTNVATVTGAGVVTGICEGSAEITAATSNGKTAKCIVTVISKDKAVIVSFDVCTTEITAPQPITVTVNKPYGDLPAPSRKGQKLVGWYTEKTGGNLVDKTTIVTNAKAHTLYARWQEWDEESQKNEEMNSGKEGSSITAKKLDITDAFGGSTGSDIRYVIKDKSQKKNASVSSKKGIINGKKSGKIEVTMQKKIDGSWTDVKTISYEVVVPKGKNLSYGIAYYEGQKVDLNELLTDNGVLHPNAWEMSSDSSIASLDTSSGVMTVGTKNGTARVNAVYGTGKYARKVKISVKINHKKVDISDAFTQVTGKKRFRISDSAQKKIAYVSSKGILKVRKDGEVTVTLQVKNSNAWEGVESKTFQVTNPLSPITK